MISHLVLLVSLFVLAGSARIPVKPSCPSDKPFVNSTCPKEPCSGTSCPNYPHAYCTNDYCGKCTARFYVHHSEVTQGCNGTLDPDSGTFNGSDIIGLDVDRSSSGRSPDGACKQRVSCPVDPCKLMRCPRVPSAVCKRNPCSCSAVRFSVDKKDVTPLCNRPLSPSVKCSPNTRKVQCLLEPCLVISCPELPSAKCKNDYCDGCNARFFVGSTEVTKMCHISSSVPKPVVPRLCDNGNVSVNCAGNPCRRSSCARFPKAVCQVDSCNGCKARFLLGSKDVTRMCTSPKLDKTMLENDCPIGLDQVDCQEDPCEASNCPRFPTANCKPNNCGVCTARFYMDGEDITESCAETERVFGRPKCPSESPRAQCFGLSCQAAGCPRYPDAVCVEDNCGKCSARFRLGVWDITEHCGGS